MKPYRIFYVASQLAPLTGDDALATETQLLVRALAECGADVMVAVPGTQVPNPTKFGLARRLDPVAVPGTGEHAAFESTIHEGKLGDGRVKILAIDLPAVLEEDPTQASEGFCRAAVTIAHDLGLRPDAVIVGPGSEAALPLARAHMTRPQPPTHQLAHGGDQAPITLYALRERDDLEAIASAVEHADWVVASSPTDAAALAARPDDDPLGGALGAARAKVVGATPGIDSQSWDPRLDGLSYENPAESKAKHKHALQRELGLRSAQSPLLMAVGPFDDELVPPALWQALMQSRNQVIIAADAVRDASFCRRVEPLLQSGRGVIYQAANSAALRAFEHRVLPGADFVLYPHAHSTSAPCQLHAMQYGTVPIAPRLATYADLLVDFDVRTCTGSGFLFTPGDGDSFAVALKQALRTYRDPEALSTLRQRIATFDLSWRGAAMRYLEFIRTSLRARNAQAHAAASAALAASAQDSAASAPQDSAAAPASA
ncbi:MAG: glycogen synthase GlgA [Haliangiales bacterium]